MIYSNSDRPLSRLHFENKTFSNKILVVLDQIKNISITSVFYACHYICRSMSVLMKGWPEFVHFLFDRAFQALQN
jgi:hypothetical protein